MITIGELLNTKHPLELIKLRLQFWRAKKRLDRFNELPKVWNDYGGFAEYYHIV